MNGPGNMVAMGGGAGGPVGGGPVINQAAARLQMDKEDQKRLNTYIYDYMLKNEQFDLARSFYKQFPILAAGPQKSSPGKRDVNGVDEMDTDSKDSIKKPADLPEPNIPSQADGSCFLYDWWCQFWDIFGARNGKSANPITGDYLHHNIAQQRARSIAQSRLISQNDSRMMNMQNYNSIMGMQQNGMMEIAKRAMNNRNATPQQMQQMHAKLMQGQMQRDGSGMEMAGQRPQSPSVGNAPSPSKRQRLDDGTGFNGQPAGPAGRGQPMTGPQINNLSAAAGPTAPGQMMLQNGITPEMQQQQMNAFSGAPNMQQKQLEAMNPSGLPHPNQIAGPPIDGSLDFINAQRLGAGGANQTGNHALQDYQMQLMLLEQQNKKRLLMARQEQDHISNHPGQGAQPGAQFSMAPAMSPSGSRAGPSPNPNDQMKRGVSGTPKVGGPGVPGSPMPDMGQNRGSPAPNFDPSQMPPNMNPQYYAQMGANMMGRPPSSHPGQFNMNMAGMTPQQIEQMRMANGNRLPNGAPWPQPGPQQQLMQQQAQTQQPQPGQQQIGTPQQRHGNMPPPPAPASQEQQQRTQPSSPAQQNQAPPTPSQAPKANPKGKKEGGASKPTKKNAPKKQGATGATPAAENAEPPTPTPSTPITPMHPDSFNKRGQNGAPQQPAAAQQPQAQPPPGAANAAAAAAAAAAQAAGPPPSAEASMAMDANAPNFGMFAEGTENPGFDLDFSMNMDSTDVLGNFDFDSLLNDDTFAFGGMGDESAPPAA